MKKYTKLALVSVLSSTLAACSSSGSDDNVVGDNLDTEVTTVSADDPLANTEANADDNNVSDGSQTTPVTTGGDAPIDDAGTGADVFIPDTETDASGITDDGSLTTDGNETGNDAASDVPSDSDDGGNDNETDNNVADGASTDDVADNGDDNNTDADGTDTNANDDNGNDADADSGDADTDTGEADTDTNDTDAGNETGETDEGTSVDPADMNDGDRITPSGVSLLGNPPTLADPFADPIPSPDQSDPFGATLEVDTEEPVAGGAPTTPKNLRIDLVSNDWAEINWTPSNDDVAVVEYRIHRSDGHTYFIRGNEEGIANGSQEEVIKYWETTSFIDCNYTRFSDQVHACLVNGPSPGDTFSYQVSAVDADGQESPRSNTITIDYHAESNAAVPKYNDFYKREGDTFAQDHDLSDTAFFLDKFEMVFEDNFDGPAIDETKWNTGLTWGDTQIINGEQQYFVNTQAQPGFGYDPFKFDNGDLVIEAIPTPAEFEDSLPPVCDMPDPTGNERCLFLSGALSSHDKFGITYGYVEGRMKVGDVAGMLSSFYLYHRFPGTDQMLHGPEIDIVEFLGENPFGDEDAFQTYHFVDTFHSELDNHLIRSAPTMFQKNETGERYSADYHTFGVLWEPQLVIWYIDGKEIKRLSGPQVARQQMNIVTYLVAGSAWAPTPADDESIYPLQYRVDYIRAYQRPEYSTNGVYPDR